jgi:hypothetical protein
MKKSDIRADFGITFSKRKAASMFSDATQLSQSWDTSRPSSSCNKKNESRILKLVSKEEVMSCSLH